MFNLQVQIFPVPLKASEQSYSWNAILLTSKTSAPVNSPLETKTFILSYLFYLTFLKKRYLAHVIRVVLNVSEAESGVSTPGT